MKKLLDMAREKKDKEGVKPIVGLNLNKNKLQLQQQAYQDASEPEYDEGQELSDEELLTYAQLIGIRLPEEDDLLWIAEEGLMVELPPDWTTDQSNQEQIIYVNKRTNERSCHHPCDHYYQQLVLQERKKRAGSKISDSKKIGGPPQLNQKAFAGPPQQIQQIQSMISPKPVDPLIKMQQEKQIKRLEQAKKKEFAEKRKAMQQKYETQKQDLVQELRTKEERTRKKYDDDLKVKREKEMKQMSEKERENEEKISRELKNYEQETKNKMERAYEQKLRISKEGIDAKMRIKKEQIKKELQTGFKKSKKEVDDQFKQKIKVLDDKEKRLNSETQQLDNQLQNEIKRLKNDIVRKKMKQHSQKIKAENDRQRQNYNRQIGQLQSTHDQKIADLQKKQPKNKIKMDQLIKQCEKEEQEEMEAFKYELEQLRQVKQMQNAQKLEQLKSTMQEAHRHAITNLVQQYSHIYEKYRNIKNQQYQNFIWEAERKSKEQYLRSLKTLQKKFNSEQQMVMIQNADSSDNNLENESLQKMDAMIQNLAYQQKETKRELDSLRLQIQNLRSQNMTVGNKLNQNQMKLYQLIQDKIKNKQ